MIRAAERDLRRRPGRRGSRCRRSARGSSGRASRPRTSAGAAARMRSPISVWRAHELPLLRRRAGRACRGSRRGSPTLPTSWSSAACRSGGRAPRRDRPSCSADRLGRGPRRRRDGRRARGCARRAPCSSTSVAWRPAEAAPAVLAARTCAGRRCAAPRWRRRASAGSTTAPCERRDLEALAVLGQRRRPRGRRAARASAVGAAEDAELVAAHPVGVPRPATAAWRRAPSRVEQRVAGRVAVGVVVGLEAVEVEQPSSSGRLGGRGSASRSSRSAQQLAPVAAGRSAESW